MAFQSSDKGSTVVNLDSILYLTKDNIEEVEYKGFLGLQKIVKGCRYIITLHLSSFHSAIEAFSNMNGAVGYSRNEGYIPPITLRYDNESDRDKDYKKISKLI